MKIMSSSPPSAAASPTTAYHHHEDPLPPPLPPPPPYPAHRKALPIYTYREDLLESIQTYQVLVVVGDTGSGKTTQLPQYLLESIPGVRICVTQPRRIAVISAARRVVEERGERLGDTVGYSIRFDRRANAGSTRLLYVTDGSLLRGVQADPEVRAYDIVVLDEAHERSVETDVLFGLLRRALRLRPALKIVVMSATLDIDKFSDFFNDAPVFSVPGRMFTVEVMFEKQLKLGTAKATFVRRAVDAAMHIHCNEEPGDVLVFLTGQQEIELAIPLFLEAHAEIDYIRDVHHRSRVRGVATHPIFSALETLEQRAIFEPAPEGIRKIVFATNIAQTSVTIPGITYVVDSGFVKQKMYDPATAVDALMIVPISQAAATQRAGRAGRTAAGKVYRLYSREAFAEMALATVPEIQRTSLIATVLALKAMGINDVVNFEFIDPPDPELVVAATKQLFWLGAVDEHGVLTPLGAQMAALPIAPPLARALISSAVDFHCAAEMLTIAAMLSVEEPWSSQRNKRKQELADAARARLAHPMGDHLTLLLLFSIWEGIDCDPEWTRENFLHARALRGALEVRKQLADVMSRDLHLPIVSALANTQHGRQPHKRPRHDRHRTTDSPNVSHNPDAAYARADILQRLDATPILRALCAAFYTNTAKKHRGRNAFYPYTTTAVTTTTTSTTTTNPSFSSSSSSPHTPPTLSLHPQSALAHDDLRASDYYVIYNDVQYTAGRAVMRIASKIRREWVEVLMGRMSVLDSGGLGGGDHQHAEGLASASSTARRASIVEAAAAAAAAVGDAGDAADGGGGGEDPEFEMVREVIDEAHAAEFCVGGKVAGGSSGRGATAADTSGKSSPLPAVANTDGNAAAARQAVVDAARARYLKRKALR
ncbi:DEAH-box ATP-dependent RNA helicase prp22 [Geranomyces variabilis]|uniref:RNA helicase n=1 Tax=Geranomyces variabilis TaxID=109894 RepID=A0AAD5XUW5_9FUNG|nr:DEAH-box ATP-dependent RNA helicase prp22 [Geranomyces variabilis]